MINSTHLNVKYFTLHYRYDLHNKCVLLVKMRMFILVHLISI